MRASPTLGAVCDLLRSVLHPFFTSPILNRLLAIYRHFLSTFIQPCAGPHRYPFFTSASISIYTQILKPKLDPSLDNTTQLNSKHHATFYPLPGSPRLCLGGYGSPVQPLPTKLFRRLCACQRCASSAAAHPLQLEAGRHFSAVAISLHRPHV
ncbi:hypothetical protein HDV57DRAFT_495474 [Trichoderma longibrachiatum]|uniref:Uncharacterized protein n=1 Tax=Trichoderma longibrachiatum ATCC 18648 TaxID=983965 RepID=A0A2T4C664_TRILO|nr:hypothetical protein M440DRAFT_309926 [Trichoderma longibrachiatum ATCC 18648]